MNVALVNLQMVCVHVVNSYSKSETGFGSYKIPDIRCSKPLIYNVKKNDQLVFLQRMLDLKIDNKEINLSLPNEIGLSLNIFTKARDEAENLLEKLKKDMEKNKDFYSENVSLFYDYIEQIQIASVFSYKAVEAFCNATIPNDFVYKKTNSKGIQEVYEISQIEKWIPTSEKLTEIIPNILNCESPKQIKYWSMFKELETLRNEIIHSKKKNSIENTKKMLSNNVLDILNSSIYILNHFIQNDISIEVFPLGFLDKKWRIYEIDDPKKIFEWTHWAE